MKKITTEVFINRSKKAHGMSTYDYSKSVYAGKDVKTIVTCKIHGDWLVTPHNHAHNKRGCPKCGLIKQSLSYNKFVKNSKPDLSHLPCPEGAKLIPLTQGKYAIVDEEDYDRLMEYNWCLDGRGYAFNNSIGKMHRFIINCPIGKVVDHKDGDKLNNRSYNLRICTQGENTRNQRHREMCSSKYKGVCYNKSKGCWRCYITINKNRVGLGNFTDEIEAAKAYDAKAKELFGEFAWLNFKEELRLC